MDKSQRLYMGTAFYMVSLPSFVTFLKLEKFVVQLFLENPPSLPLVHHPRQFKGQF